MNRAAVIGLAGLAVAVAIVFGMALDSAVDLVNAPLFMAVGAECIILALALLARPERDLPFLCDPVVLFVFFQFQFFVAGPIALPYTSVYSRSTAPPETIVITVLVFIVLLIMLLVGYHSPLGSLIAERLPSFKSRSGKFRGIWIERSLLLTCLASCVAYVYYQGGVVAMLNTGYGGGKAGAVFQAPFLLLVLTTLLIGWRVFSAPAPRWRDASLLIALLVFEIGFWGILLGQRKWLFNLFFGLAAIFLLRRGRRAVPRFVLPAILGALVVYLSVWGVVRGRPLALLMSDRSAPQYGETRALHTGYLESVADPFNTACLVLQIFPDREPYRYGQTLLVALLSPIPRTVWPTKPIGLGKELTWYLGSYYAASYDTSKGLSITPTLVGDFYANLGMLGIVLGGFVFGIGFRVVAAYAVKGMRDGLQLEPARALIPAVFVSGLVELRAETAMLVLFYMYTLLPLLGILTFFSFRADDGSAVRPT